MSILAGPYNKTEVTTKGEDDNELLVFGYACKLFRDDAKAIMEDSGQLLIPWMGDNSLLVDRYDVRNRLEDKRRFGLKPNLSRPVSAEDREMEEELNKERYLALEWDDIRVEEQEEEEKKRRHENAFNAVGFTYNENTAPVATSAGMNSNLSLPEHPSTSSVDHGDEDKFIPPPGLLIPEGIQTPSTNKLHSIIEKTASFVSKQGTQMEIIIKTKQKFNPFFSFLNYKDVLFPYYTHLKDMILTGGYLPKLQLDMRTGPRDSRGRSNNRLGDGDSAKTKEGAARGSGSLQRNLKSVVEDVKTGNGSLKAAKTEPDSNSDSDSDSDDGYLHPLLMKASLKASKPSTPEPAPPPPETTPKTVTATKKLSIDELLNLRSSSFVARSRAVNSAPPLGSVATHGQVTSNYGEAEALASYEHYRQQYFGSSLSAGPGQDAGYSYPLDSTLPPPHDACTTDGRGQGYPYSDQYHAYFSQFSQPVPPPDLRPVVDKTAEYVAKNSDSFERTVLNRHIGDARFNFLNPWDQYHAYYQLMKEYNRARLQQESAPSEEMVPREFERPNVQKLSSSGAVSFKLQSKANPPPLMLSAPCSKFGPENNLEDVEDSYEAVEETQECPPAKKQRVENGDESRAGGEEDDIGRTVQAFLETVKEMHEPMEESEGMGNTVQAFLSTVKGMLGAEYQNN